MSMVSRGTAKQDLGADGLRSDRAMIEPKADPRTPSTSTIDPIETPRLMLSPRVIDEAAFERYAATLEQIVKDASRAAASTREATDRARRLLGSDAVADLTGLDERRARVEQDTARAEEVARKAMQAASEAAKLSQNLERLALAASDGIENQRGGLDSLRSRVQEAIEGALSTLASGTTRTVGLIDRAAENATSRITVEAKGVHERTIESIRAAAGDIADLERDARTAARESVEALVTDLTEKAVERVRLAAEGEHARISEAVTKLDERIARADHAAATLGASVTTVEDRVRKLDHHLELIEKRIASQTRSLGSIDAKALDRAETVLTGFAEAGVDETVSRLEKVTLQANASATRLEALGDQSRVATSALGEAILESADKIDRLYERLDQLEALAAQNARKHAAKRTKTKPAEEKPTVVDETGELFETGPKFKRTDTDSG